MKTTEQMFQKAFDIANDDPNARVGVFVKADLKNATMHNMGMHGGYQYIATNGGRVMFFDIDESNMHEMICGHQFSHAFITDLFTDGIVHRYIKSRVRSPHELIEPSGVYWPYGVERWMAY